MWVLHCHIAWHVSTGLLVHILERPNDLRSPRVASASAQTCGDWAAYTKANAPDQIDSGLRVKG